MQHDHPIWTRDAVARTEAILRGVQKNPSVTLVDELLLHVLLFLAIAGNFLLSVVMVPVLIALRGGTLYICIFIIAMSFGALFSFILHGIDVARPHHHLIAGLLIPALALINVAIFANLTNKLIVLLRLAEPGHNPWLVGAVYVSGYVLPEAMAHLITNAR